MAANIQDDGTTTAEIISPAPALIMINDQVIPSDLAAPKWQIEISIDAQAIDSSSPAPPQRPDQILALAVGSYLIGRTSQKRAISPEISLDFDDAISHRHALIELRIDRSLILRDTGSANGTSLNGHKIPLTRDIPLQSGDIITLGHWTKLTVIKE
jgi:hypothetical protein